MIITSKFMLNTSTRPLAVIETPAPTTNSIVLGGFFAVTRTPFHGRLVLTVD
jgi:hypothetical protein